MKPILKILFAIFLFLINITLIAQDQKICEILFSSSILENNDFVSLQFYSAKKKLIKECQGIQFNTLIEKNVCDFDIKNTSNYYFIAYGGDGKKVTFSYSDISPKISKIPAFIAFREKLVIPDTVKISGISGTKISENEFKKVNKVFTYMQVYKIYLQMISIPKDTLDRIIKKFFIIFPQDQTTDRWIGDLEKIEIYKIQG